MKKMQPTALATLIVISICLFLLLPVPYNKISQSCPKATCKGYEFVQSEQKGWYWLGGYHTTIEAFIPKDISQTLDYEEKYRGVSGGSVAVLVITSIALP